MSLRTDTVDVNYLWETLAGGRTIVRKNTASKRTLASLAMEGPKNDHTLGPMDLGNEEIHRLLVRRAVPADEKVWAKHCPKPVGWDDEDIF